MICNYCIKCHYITNNGNQICPTCNTSLLQDYGEVQFLLTGEITKEDALILHDRYKERVDLKLDENPNPYDNSVTIHTHNLKLAIEEYTKFHERS